MHLALPIPACMWNISKWSAKYCLSNYFIWWSWSGREQLAPPLEEKVAKTRHLYIFQVHAGAPHLMLRLSQIRETPLLYRQAMSEMCLSAIGNMEHPPKYRVTINHTVMPKCHSDLRYLPIPMRNIPAAIYIPSTLLKHLVKCIFPQESLV